LTSEHRRFQLTLQSGPNKTAPLKSTAEFWRELCQIFKKHNLQKKRIFKIG